MKEQLDELSRIANKLVAISNDIKPYSTKNKVLSNDLAYIAQEIRNVRIILEHEDNKSKYANPFRIVSPRPEEPMID